MDIIAKLMFTSLLVFVIMWALDELFHISEVKNYWCGHVYPLVGGCSVIITAVFLFIYLLMFIWT